MNYRDIRIALCSKPDFTECTSKLRQIMACAIILVLHESSHAFAQRTIPKIETEGALTDAELGGDPILSLPIQLTSKSLSVEGVLVRLSESSKNKLTFSAVEALKPRNLTLFCVKTTTLQAMRGIAYSLRGSWKKSGSGYELFQTKGQIAEEKNAILRSESREASAAIARMNALKEAIENAKDTDFGKYLATIDPEKIQLALEASGEPEGAMSATDQSHLHSQLLFSQPTYELSAEAQSAVGAMLGQPSSDKFEGVAGLEHTPGDSTTQVGLVAYAGGLMLGTVTQDGSDVSISPHHLIQKKGIPGVDSDSGGEAEVEEAIKNRKLVFIDSMPLPMQRIPLKFVQGRERTQLATLLESIAKQLGLSILSDDFLHSRTPQYPWLLTDQPTYTAREALTQIASSFGREIHYKNGILRLRTVTVGLDLRSEPPNSLMESLGQAVAKKRNLNLSEYLHFGRLSPLQARTLFVNMPTSFAQLSLFQQVFKQWHALRLFASLNSKQLASAEGEKGFMSQAMSGEQRKLFLRSALSGLPQLKIWKAPASLTPDPKNAVFVTRSANSLIIRFFNDKGKEKVFEYPLEPEKTGEK